MGQSPTRKKVYDAIWEERQYQDSLRVTGRFNRYNYAISEELVMMDAYLAWAKATWTDIAGDNATLHIIRKIAALGVRCMENRGVISRGFEGMQPGYWDSIIDVVDCECHYQATSRYNAPGPNGVAGHTLCDWVIYLEWHLNRAKEDICHSRVVDTLIGVRTIVALCVLCMEQLGVATR